MAVFVANNVKAWMDGYDISGDLNKLGLVYAADMVEATAYGHDTHIQTAGLKDIKAELEGWWQTGADEIDPVLFDRLGIADTVFSCSPDGGDEGEIGFSFKTLLGEYSPGASIGELLAFKCTAGGRGSPGLIRGTVMHNATRSSDSSGTARQLGAVSATQYLYASLHVLAVTGSSTPTLTVKVQSDNLEAFGSATDRITFTNATAIGAQFATPVAGAITDDWWRINWAMTGTTPGFTFVVVVGIQ